MGAFTYVAAEDSGKKVRGTIEASNLDTAVASLNRTGVHLLDIQEARGERREARRGKGGVSKSDLALFTRRLADLSSAGLPLDRALTVCGEQSGNATLGAVTEAVVKDVHSGIPVSEALARYPDLFPTVYTMTMRAGEASGQFPQVASRLADFQQLEVRRRSQIVGALIYPAILLCSAAGAVTFMELFVVPRLSGVFHDLGSDLPLTTRLLLDTSDFLAGHWLPLVLGFVAMILAWKAFMRTEQGLTLRDRWALTMPVLGKVISKAVVSRYARVLGTLIYGGVPILEALRIAGAASGNRLFVRSSDKVQQDVREGRRLGEAMRDAGTFSSILVQMVAVGEETGDLPLMLNRVAETLDFEVDQGMQKLTTMLEPLIVLTAGSFIGFVVISILLPIYQAQNLIK